MKAKKILIGLSLVICAGAAVCAFFWWRHEDKASSGDDEKVEPTVVSVQVGTLKRLTLHHYVTAYGTVEPAPAIATVPAASARLAPSVSGTVVRINVAEGQRVKKGEVLMELNSSSVTLKYAEDEVARQKKLYAEQNTSLRNLQNAEDQLAALRVVAPLSGIVTQVNVASGAAVDASTVLAEIVDLSRLTVRSEISVPDAAELKPGEDEQVLTQPPVTGTLFFISPTVDTNSGTVLARAELPAGSGLRPGQFVQLRIVTGIHTNCVAAPAESVVTDINGHSVIALVNGDEAAQSTVKTGYRENGWVEVENIGLKAGDTVVTVGAYGLPDKTKIEVVKPSETNDTQTNVAQ
jgi:membrane fusion protein (multidrug efflux system)